MVLHFQRGNLQGHKGNRRIDNIRQNEAIIKRYYKYICIGYFPEQSSPFLRKAISDMDCKI